MKVKSENINYQDIIMDWKKAEVKIGDLCDNGFQLRPHVVWFGEDVPLLEKASKIVATADIFVVIGTSLNVYPAAGLIHSCPVNCKRYIIDPKADNIESTSSFMKITATAQLGIDKLRADLID